MMNMDDQQWEFWDYDASSWDFVHEYDHITASESAFTTADDNDDDGDHHRQPALSLQQQPTHNVSSSFLGDEDDKHLFAASMFQGTSRGIVHQHLDCDQGDMSVDSECTVQTCNKTTGGLDDSTKTEESNDSANTTASSKTPLEVNAITFAAHEGPIIRRRSRSNTHLQDNHSRKLVSFSSAAGEKEVSSAKHEIAPVSKISLSDTLLYYADEPTETHHRRRRGSWSSGRRVAGVGGGRALAA
mmetsp:Transcript_2183/g.4009  ORF Transcript_2183/g.4009 Transcript_2183/m.4009 type:complete len:243 (-) Transcript_2183:209-937(-)